MQTWTLDPTLFPLPHGAHPQRPWWRRVDWCSDRIGECRPEGLPDWRRRDGHEVSEPSSFDAHLRATLDAAPAPSAEEQMARIDRESPLPRPPFRAGQVWVEPNGIQTLILRVGPDEDPWGVTDDEAVTEVDLVCVNACLVHDPICPADAPWAPTETLVPDEPCAPLETP